MHHQKLSGVAFFVNLLQGGQRKLSVSIISMISGFNQVWVSYNDHVGAEKREWRVVLQPRTLLSPAPVHLRTVQGHLPSMRDPLHPTQWPGTQTGLHFQEWGALQRTRKKGEGTGEKNISQSLQRHVQLGCTIEELPPESTRDPTPPGGQN